MARVAVYECPCCEGRSSRLLAKGRRAARSAPCGNGGCWRCVGACRGRMACVGVERDVAARVARDASAWLAAR